MKCSKCGEYPAKWMDMYCQECWERYTATAFWDAIGEPTPSPAPKRPAPKRSTLRQLPERVAIALVLWDWQPWRWAKTDDRFCFDLPDAWLSAGIIQETKMRGDRA
jgi:hypothetical protein